MRTIFPQENGEIGSADTALTQETPESIEPDVKWPKKVKHRKQVLAKIYRPCEGRGSYRVAWSVAGKRIMKSFPTYGGKGGALEFAEKLVKDLAEGSQVAALTPGQAADALTAFEHLAGHYKSTGIKLSLAAVTSVFCESAKKLGVYSMTEAVDGFLKTAVMVKAKDVAQAVEDFIAGEEPRTKAKNGNRPEVSPKYHYNRSIMLRRFAAAFPSTAVNELTKEHLDAFFAGLGKVASKSRNRKAATSAKSRNHHRAAVRQFLQWCVRKDYLPATHRLNEADAMRLQNGNDSEIQFYTPAEFKALLETAHGPMRAMIAIGGLAGLRTAEMLRLTWEDTRRVEGHIEITSGKAKTRQRRLVEIVPALAQWLALFGEFTGKIWAQHEITFQQNLCRLCDKAEYESKPGHKATVPRKPNGLRHAFCTYHLAAHSNENATAIQAGNSPQMLFGHYRGLARKKEGEAWFAVSPEQPGNVVQLGNAATK